jgi:glycosyltransferase involved in cell wall biosynthesis
MKVALVHDYLSDFGGAERVLLALSELYPKAPIYTAFYKKGSVTHNRLKNKRIITSWVQNIPYFVDMLHSPLRFLAPMIWGSFDFSEFDVVISSASWYITKGINVPDRTLHISYIHTPPRYLYGYQVSVDWQKYFLVRQYAKVVNKYLRVYDFESAQKPDVLVANSKNVQKRILKFYRRESKIIYPPVDLPKIELARRGDYYLVISRIVGGKGLSLAIKAANRMKVPLKVVGKAVWGKEEEKLKSIAGNTVEFTGYVEDKELSRLYAGAKAFLALAENEDFGITPVEAMGAGTPVIAYQGGGYLETVIEGKTGVFFKKQSVDSLVDAMEKLDNMEILEKDCREQAEKFSKERFMGRITELVDREYKGKKNA